MERGKRASATRKRATADGVTRPEFDFMKGSRPEQARSSVSQTAVSMTRWVGVDASWGAVWLWLWDAVAVAEVSIEVGVGADGKKAWWWTSRRRAVWCRAASSSA